MYSNRVRFRANSIRFEWTISQFDSNDSSSSNGELLCELLSRPPPFFGMSWLPCRYISHLELRFIEVIQENRVVWVAQVVSITRTTYKLHTNYMHRIRTHISHSNSIWIRIHLFHSNSNRIWTKLFESNSNSSKFESNDSNECPSILTTGFLLIT